MNKTIRNIDLERILFFDIESVSQNRELDVNSEEYRDYSLLLRDRTTGFMPPAKEIKTHYENNAALYAEYNKIVTVSVGFIKDRVLYYKAIVGTQKEILEEFYKIASETGFDVCGHNVKFFDIPQLRIKAWQEGLDLSIIPDKMVDSGAKPWELKILDTMEIIKGTGYKNMSLSSACRLIGIPSSKDDISGSEVTKTYYAEGVERIAKYCNKDVIASAHLFCSLAGKKDYIIKEVDRLKEPIKEPEDIKLIDHVRISGELTADIADQLVVWAEETGQNKKNVLELIITALSHTRVNNKVDLEDYIYLKERLDLVVETDLIDCVVKKQSIGKVQVKDLISSYENSDKKVKLEVIKQVEDYIKDIGKQSQVRIKKSIELLKEELMK